MKNRFPASYRPFLLLAILLTALCLMPAPLFARIFARRGDAGGLTSRIEAMGGSRSYTSRITLNGGSGELHVFAFQAPPGRIARLLTEAFGARGLATDGASLQIGEAEVGALRLRLVLVQPEAAGVTTLFAVAQSAAQYERSLSAPETVLAPFIPYPDARPTFTVSDEQSGVALTLAVTGAEPQTVQDYFDRELTTRGWSTPPVGSATKGLSAAPMALRLYVQADAVCCVGVTRSEQQSGETTITLLHKRLGMK